MQFFIKGGYFFYKKRYFLIKSVRFHKIQRLFVL